MTTLIQNRQVDGLYQPESFEVSQNAAQTIAGGGNGVAVICGVEQYDPNNWHSTVDGKFTPLIAGTYEFQGTAVLLNAADQEKVWVGFVKNGSTYRWVAVTSASGTTGGTGGGGVQRFYMNGSTDYVQMYLYHSVAGNKNSFGGTDANSVHWGGRKICDADICGL